MPRSARVDAWHPSCAADGEKTAKEKEHELSDRGEILKAASIERTKRRKKKTMADLNNDEQNLPVAAAAAVVAARGRRQHPPTTIADLPLDVLVRIFLREGGFYQDNNYFRWVLATFPLVCRAWCEFFRGPESALLRSTFVIDPRVDAAPFVFANAKRNASAVRRLLVDARNVENADEEQLPFKSLDLSSLVSAMAWDDSCRLSEIEIWADTEASLIGPPFWTSLHAFAAAQAAAQAAARAAALPAAPAAGDRVAASGLRSLAIHDIRRELPQRLLEPLGRLTGLETLVLRGLEVNDLDVEETNYGLNIFPPALLALTRLTRLAISENFALRVVPAGISSLQELRSLELSGCSLSALPGELGQLSRLTSLDLDRNPGLGRAAERERAQAFPQALRGMASLRRVILSRCGLRNVPDFVQSLALLEHLCLLENADISLNGPFPVMRSLRYLDLIQCAIGSLPYAVLTRMPGLRTLRVDECRLTTLPEDFGRNLQQLRSVSLCGNTLTSVPAAALSTATNLEIINLSFNDALQVPEPLDPLLNLQRLRVLRLQRNAAAGPWTVASTDRLSAFIADLRVRRPTARVELVARPTAPAQPAATEAAAVQAAAADAAAEELASVAARAAAGNLGN